MYNCFTVIVTPAMINFPNDCDKEELLFAFDVMIQFSVARHECVLTMMSCICIIFAPNTCRDHKTG